MNVFCLKCEFPLLIAELKDFISFFCANCNVEILYFKGDK